ncbi:ABC transporter ATP-binding protein [Acetobacter estunensis]|uniref:ABC transporter ATP-binding protein n=1 Tax=Acetobacter estunensis TaxID=104097 RepID=UPI001C2D68E8|nr:ABC transporter ATP-binding protein [Acetobacter estunensis]MBV1836822.1 ABC transporter ATP-binding protein [Acetobacter estunensis]
MTVTPTPPAPTHLCIEKIVKRYPGQVALDHVSLSVERGCYVVLLGPSGSGKTTLLSIIGGFTMPDSGAIRIGGEDVTALPPSRRPTTTVFQDYALFPHMTVAANVGFGLKMKPMSPQERKQRVQDMLRLVGLEQQKDRAIQALSGGQRQRVALARALAVDPEILLLDEPLGALDLALRRQVQEELRRLQRQMNRTFIHVTHDQEEAMALADLVVVMSHGRIEDVGTPRRVYLRPASRFTATFMGESTQITGRVTHRAGDVLTLETAFGMLEGIAAPNPGAVGDMPSRSTVLQKDDEAVAIIRPENFTFSPDNKQSLPTATVMETIFQGNYVRILALTDAGQELVLCLPPQQAPTVGTRIVPCCSVDDVVIVPA